MLEDHVLEAPDAGQVQGLVALLEQEQEELDRLKMYKAMGMGYPGRRQQRSEPRKSRARQAQKQRAEAIIADDEEVLLVLSAALELME